MKTLNHCLVVSICALLVPLVGLAAPAVSDGKTAESKSGAVSPDSPVSNLKRAMSADEVRQIMGRPVEIKPMAAPMGKAEIWIYKRKINERTELVQIGTPAMTTTAYGIDGRAYTQTVGGDTHFANVHYATEETIQLLMFNGQFVSGKISRQPIRYYD